jgi:ribosome-associated translation inhibitor RaiA
MQTTITARHCEINEALRERARSVVDDHRTALDRAEEKLRRQLDKDRDNPKARRSRDSVPKIG